MIQFPKYQFKFKGIHNKTLKQTCLKLFLYMYLKYCKSKFIYLLFIPLLCKDRGLNTGIILSVIPKLKLSILGGQHFKTFKDPYKLAMETKSLTKRQLQQTSVHVQGNENTCLRLKDGLFLSLVLILLSYMFIHLKKRYL